MDELRAELDRCAADAATPRPADGVRMPIDRAFSLRGIGTVVTGTLWSGAIAAGDHLAVEPGGRPVRVRSVQVHDQQVERAAAGQRVAVRWSASSGRRWGAATPWPSRACCARVLPS
jgi:selenocysteine-specific elongation factor